MTVFIIFGLLTVTGLRWAIGWCLLRPDTGVPFVASGWWSPEEKTWSALLKIAYWAISITLYYFAFEAFLVLLIVQGIRLAWELKKVFISAFADYGIFRGLFVGLWRSVPLFFEPFFFDEIKKAYKGWVVRHAPQDSSLSRFLPKNSGVDPPDPEPDPPRPQKDKPARTKKFKVHVGKEKPTKAALKKWETENLPLPHKGQDKYGLKPGEYYIVDFVLEEHDADDVGLHYDFRWRHPTLGIVDAVALPKAKLPALGEPVLAVKSDAKHGRKELKNLPYKATGYGAGTTKTLQEGRAILWVDPDSHHLHIITDKNEAFAFVKTKNSGPDEWLLQRLSDSPVGGKPVPHMERTMVFRDISRNPEKILTVAASGYTEVKYDGAMYTLVRDKSGRTMLISRRPMHRDNTPVALEDGHMGIDRIYWLPEVQNLPEDVLPRDTVIQVEVLSQARGRYSSSHARTAALLNTGVASSIKEQEKGGKLIVKLLKVERYEGRDWSDADIFEERKFREEIGRKSNRVLHVPAARFTPEGGYKLYKREVRGGREGVVVRGKVNYKVKARETWDYPLYAIYPVDPLKRASNVRSKKEIGATRNPGSKWLVNGVPQGAGGVGYLTAYGAVGEAGSGLTDEMRRDLWLHPERYLGEGNVVQKDGVYYAKDPSQVPTYVEVSGMSRSRTTEVVRAPVIEGFRQDK